MGRISLNQSQLTLKNNEGIQTYSNVDGSTNILVENPINQLEMHADWYGRGCHNCGIISFNGGSLLLYPSFSFSITKRRTLSSTSEKYKIVFNFVGFVILYCPSNYSRHLQTCKRARPLESNIEFIEECR